MKHLILAVVCTLMALPMGSAHSASQSGFKKWIAKDLWPEARAAGISRKTFDQTTKRLKFDPTMPDLEGSKPKKQRQSEFRAPGRYFRPKSMQGLAARGAGLVNKWRAVLDRVERRTGVPRRIIVAIWGRESGFGRAKMAKNAIAALATSAYAGRRKTLFRKELLAALRIVQEGHVSAADMGSSWAGALGQPQFLPSKFFEYAVDEDGDGRRDIWNSVPDTLGSIGNYLAKHGWQKGRDWGFEAIVPRKVSCALGGPDQGRKISEWVAMGVTRAKPKPFPKIELRNPGYLLFPGGRYGPAFVTTPNFYVLKKYNESDVYALFIGHLADRMAGGGSFIARWRRIDTLNRQDVKKMQQRLIKKGYDVGGADGLIGYKSRSAIGQWQAKNGIKQTCFPNRETVRKVR